MLSTLLYMCRTCTDAFPAYDLGPRVATYVSHYARAHVKYSLTLTNTRGHLQASISVAIMRGYV